MRLRLYLYARPRIGCQKHFLCPGSGDVSSARTFKSLPIRRRLAEKMVAQFSSDNVKMVGHEMACLLMLMECGSTEVEMSDGAILSSIKQMREYFTCFGYIVSAFGFKVQLHANANSFQVKNALVPDVFVLKVDATDSIITDYAFRYLSGCTYLEKLKLNFCDYFGEDGLRELTLGRPAVTLKDLEIVCNPRLSDSMVLSLVKLRGLRRAHFYFIPYVCNRPAILRQVRLALPKCKITFPETSRIGYGYDDK